MELLTPPGRPSRLPEVVSVREGLSIGGVDRGLALANADLSTSLQLCVRALVAQRVQP